MVATPSRARERSRGCNLVFVDSSFWVAIADKKDQWHSRAVELKSRITPGIHVLDLAASEALTIIGSRKGGKPAQALYQVFQDTCSIVYLDAMLLDSAMERHLRHDGRLSVPDCAMVEAMVHLDDRTVLSFDSDFDLVRGLERVH